MTVGILGSGDVGMALAKGLLAEGQSVYIATRQPDGDKGDSLKAALPKAVVTDFASTAKAAELIILCVNESGLHEAIELAGQESLQGKVIIDTTNAIKPVDGVLVYAGGEVSMAEQVQAWLPDAKVVKAFNTAGAAIMYKPDFGEQTPTMFIAGDDDEAKKMVSDIVVMFGWEALDCGKLVLSRSLEPMALVWINNSMASGSPHHAFKML
jgi:predicted dinucleotide-binding enzyme